MTSSLRNQSSDHMETIRKFMRQGLAVEPALIQGVGEVARLILRDQSIVIPHTTRRFIRQLCETQFFEFQSLREQAKRIIGKKQLVPIPLTYRTVFFPLRIASVGQIKPRNFLWVNHRCIWRVTEGKKDQHSELALTNGATFWVPYRRAFIQQQIRDSFLLEYFFQEAHYQISSPHRPSHLDQPDFGAWQDRFLQIAEPCNTDHDPYKNS